eukprot:CAMPEP_0118918084 /NCGR_PEP_ID=MMETSP1166-20130328/17699_1 /TAXON_ID=1104430 /ORGANISM="Chrysoreinhardia sp, Strain CCMP3193" /LENGTH=232 /DNA_ID=CAMNT_0006858329 /DNA_START=14 /DNA_END=709 /DNA_ORIENTATION=-
MMRKFFRVFFCFVFALRGIFGWSGVVTLKLAVDRNGGVDDLSGKAFRFTTGESLDAAHRLRRASDAVLVGVQTVLRDDPSLTVRRVRAERQPLRVVLDSKRRTPRDAKILNDGGAPSVVFVGDPRDPFEEPIGPLRDVLDILEAKYGVSKLMVEGGPTTARTFLKENLVDRAVVVRSPITFKDPVPSHIDANLLRNAGLAFLGKHTWGLHDDVSMWARPQLRPNPTFWDELE